jgi:hypothetical protein
MLGLLLALAAIDTANAQQKFPGKGEVKIGSGPLPLLIHYVDGTGAPVQVELRRMQFQPPPLQKSKELAAIAKLPCGKGDVVNVSSRLEGVASGTDAAGIGRFIWLLDGQYTTDGEKWSFVGKARANDDLYDFNKGKDGERAFWQEVATKLGSSFPGKSFRVKISGSVDVGISGVCGLNSAGQVLV